MRIENTELVSRHRFIYEILENACKSKTSCAKTFV